MHEDRRIIIFPLNSSKEKSSILYIVVLKLKKLQDFLYDINQKVNRMEYLVSTINYIVTYLYFI